MTAARRVEATRAYLAGIAVFGAVLVFLSARALHAVYGIVLAPFAALAVLWWWRGVFSSRRVVLWLEERVPSMRYALAALVDGPDTRFRAALEERVRAAHFARPLALAGLKLVGLPLVLFLGILLIVRPLAARVATGPTAARILGVARSGPDAALGAMRFAATVTPPAYAGLRQTRVDNPTSVAALAGSGIRFRGAWNAETTMPSRPTVFRLQGANGQRIVALEPRADSAPRVVLELPARDTVLAVARGRIPLQASARDDIGIVSGQFEVIISSGSGESFKFRSATLGQASANGARDLRLATTIDLDSLKLDPGDIVHLRAIARDANPQPGADAGSSETRTLRVFRPGEADSSAIEVAPPPEVGKSELSQRMLIIMTEKLVAQMRRLSRDAVRKESGSIAQEQARLRKRVGQIIFSRLTGEEGDEPDADEAMADTLDPGQALLRAAEAATGHVDALEHAEGNDSPVIAVNRPLLEAFNAMWEAERRLGVVEPRQALPFMRAALDAIQKARAAERLYLRGRPPRIVLDIERIRLQGKKDGIDPRERSARASAVAAQLERQSRFHAALTLLGTRPAAAIDSLILVRVDVLAEQPRLAAALERVIDDLRSGRDATAALRGARRALVGEPTSGRVTGWSGSW